MIKTFNTHFRAAVVLTIAGLLAAGAQAQEIAVKSGEKIAFLGDSITQQGAGSPSGYVRLVISGLAANGVKAEPIPAGISGHKSNDMLARLDRDVISKQPNWMTLSCGVNDVWHGEKGVPLDQYKANITQIVDKAQAANIKVVILTATMIGEDQPNANNQKLVAYNDFLKSLAAERKLPLADLNAEMQAQIAAAPAHYKNYLTVDGVHMNPLGNMMMATGVLKALGLNDAQLQTAHNAWLDMPEAVNLPAMPGITLRQYTQLRVMADKQNTTVDALLKDAVAKAVEGLLRQN
jgi:lysophospholipase L1-like esterase